MSALTIGLLRGGVLVGMWLVAVVAVIVIRTDLRRDAPVAVAATGPSDAPASSTPITLATRLVVIDGAQAGMSVELGARTATIGRAADSTLVLSDDYVSHHHARLTPSPGGWILTDLDSTNGTIVDGMRIEAPVALATGKRFIIGRTSVELG
jgi:predicted component of type VI protein secretion system